MKHIIVFLSLIFLYCKDVSAKIYKSRREIVLLPYSNINIWFNLIFLLIWGSNPAVLRAYSSALRDPYHILIIPDKLHTRQEPNPFVISLVPKHLTFYSIYVKTIKMFYIITAKCIFVYMDSKDKI